MNLLSGKTKYLAFGSWLLLVAGAISFFVAPLWIWPTLFGSGFLRATLPRKSLDPDPKRYQKFLFFGVFFLVLGISDTTVVKKFLAELRSPDFSLPAIYFIVGVGCLIARATIIDFNYLKSVPEKDIKRFHHSKDAE